MLSTVCGIIHGGKIELSESIDLPEGRQVLVTLLSDSEREFWEAASEPSLAEVWADTEDDVYARLIEK